MVMATDDYGQQPAEAVDEDGKPKVDEKEKALVAKIVKAIKADKEHYKKAFNRMRRDMFVTMNGREQSWPETNYKANICGRHVKQKVAALYAKNPKVVAGRRETMDFVVWDENPESLTSAFDIIAQAEQMMLEQQAPIVDVAGMSMQAEPQLPPGFEESRAIVEDFQAGMQRRESIKRIGMTLQVLFSQAMREQKPLDFKRGMKRCVQRALTNGVGYVEVGFQRETGSRPGLTEQLADARSRLDHIKRLATEVAEGEIEQDDPEMAELEAAVAALQEEPEIVLREGLIFDFPQSTKVIPDRLCRSIVGFTGSRHLTIEYLYTHDQVEELFGKDLKDGKGYAGYDMEGKPAEDSSSSNQVPIDGDNDSVAANKGHDMVCVWKHYDKSAGLIYFVADGYECYLREPMAPEVFVEDFWPVYALTFNDVESETEPFPPSDVTLLLDPQNEYNRSRQGKREHRMAARPRWAASSGAWDSEEDIAAFKRAEPFSVSMLNKDPQTKLADILEIVPVPGVDPNLYDTGEIVSDVQFIGGMQESNYGGVAQATATESAIAANSSASTDGSAIDDLDSFLTVVARAGGQVLLREMSEEQVMRVVGPGALWPHMTLADIAEEIYLEVEAGSTGKPNQAVEIQNWTQMLPFLLQMPSIAPTWLARESLRRLDDKLDLTDALVSGIPAIVAQNRMAGTPQPTNPADTDTGGDNGPRPPENTGSDAEFGSNQV